MSEFLIILSVTLSCFFTIFLIVFTHLQSRKMLDYVQLALRDIMQVLKPPQWATPAQQPYAQPQQQSEQAPVVQPVHYPQAPPLPYKLPSDIQRTS